MYLSIYSSDSESFECHGQTLCTFVPVSVGKTSLRESFWSSKRAQWVNVFAAKPDNLSLLPVPMEWKEKSD